MQEIEEFIKQTYQTQDDDESCKGIKAKNSYRTSWNGKAQPKAFLGFKNNSIMLEHKSDYRNSKRLRDLKRTEAIRGSVDLSSSSA